MDKNRGKGRATVPDRRGEMIDIDLGEVRMNSNDPRDLAHTSREHPGEAIEDARNWPGYALIGLGIVALGLTLVAAGYGFAGWAWIAGIVCVCGLLAGILLVAAEHRRVKRLDNASLTDQVGH